MALRSPTTAYNLCGQNDSSPDNLPTHGHEDSPQYWILKCVEETFFKDYLNIRTGAGDKPLIFAVTVK